MLEKSSTELFPTLTESDKDNIRSRIEGILAQVKESTNKSPYHQNPRVLLATKTRTPDEINYAISLGIDLIGENRVQELIDKYDAINKENVEIHFIGALQTNKVKYIIDKVCLIHSLDRISLAKEIDKQAAKHGKIMDVLVEVNIGDEDSKSGVAVEEVEEFLHELSSFPNIRVKGLMAIPPVMTSISTQKQYFQKIMDLYLDISAKKIDNVSMTVLSIGMSSDFGLAIEHGSTLVRIGTAAFGERIYKV